MQRFDWDDLRFFLAVARSGRLTLAARRLGADHATVSRRISSLETSLKAKLFERRPQGYTLTAHGERLLAKAESMETDALAIQSEIGGADMALSGVVRIGAPDGFGTIFLAPRLPRFAALSPALEVQLVAMPRLLSLSKREADVAITLAPPKEARSSPASSPTIGWASTPRRLTSPVRSSSRSPTTCRSIRSSAISTT